MTENKQKNEPGSPGTDTPKSTDPVDTASPADSTAPVEPTSSDPTPEVPKGTNALVYNANNLIAAELVRALALRGYTVVASDTDDLFYVKEVLEANPELEGKVIPLKLPEDITVAVFDDKVKEIGITKFQLVVDFNKSGTELISDDYHFLSKAIQSDLCDEDCVVCFGNSRTVVSTSAFKAAKGFVQKIKDDITAAKSDALVINLLDAKIPASTAAKALAAYYLNSILRATWRIKKIVTAWDFLQAAVYFTAPLWAYKYIDATCKAFNEWTSPVPSINDDDYLL